LLRISYHKNNVMLSITLRLRSAISNRMITPMSLPLPRVIACPRSPLLLISSLHHCVCFCMVRPVQPDTPPPPVPKDFYPFINEFVDVFFPPRAIEHTIDLILVLLFPTILLVMSLWGCRYLKTKDCNSSLSPATLNPGLPRVPPTPLLFQRRNLSEWHTLLLTIGPLTKPQWQTVNFLR
jgi:hypothetical protein